MENFDCQKLKEDFQRLIALKVEFDGACEAALSGGNREQARELQTQVEGAVMALEELVEEDSCEVGLRDKLARELGYDYIGGFHDGWAVAKKGGKDCYIDKEGKQMETYPATGLQDFSEGYAWTKIASTGAYRLIDVGG